MPKKNEVKIWVDGEFEVFVKYKVKNEMSALSKGKKAFEANTYLFLIVSNYRLCNLIGEISKLRFSFLWKIFIKFYKNDFRAIVKASTSYTSTFCVNLMSVSWIGFYVIKYCFILI